MPSEEEQQQTGATNTTDTAKQTEQQLESKEGPYPEKPLTAEEPIEKEPLDEHKFETERRRPEASDEHERTEETNTADGLSSVTDSLKKSTEETNKPGEPDSPAEESSNTINASSRDPVSRLTNPDSSPQPEVPSSTAEEDAAGEKAAPASSAAAPADEEDDDDEEDDEDPADNDQEQDEPPQQNHRKQRSAGSRDDYNNEDDPSGADQQHQEQQQQQQQQQQQEQQQQEQTPTGGAYYEDDEEDDEDEGEEPSELRQLFAPINDSQALSEDEEDGDYIPDEEVKKTIMVGSDFQAVIPEGLCRYDDALPYENEDKLLWNPTILNEQEIEDYLVKITSGPAVAAAAAATAAGGLSAGAGATATPAGGQQKGSPPGTGTTGTNTNTTTGTIPTNDPQSANVYSIPLGNHLRDDEQSLYLLQQCGHNVDEALRRKRISNNAVPVPEQQMSIWSEEECRNFENGLRVHGKDFHMIQQTKVRTRSVGELVQFYYLWKKTERHDLFASKARLEKKKYNLHPGLTDHMDRFLEEQENSTGGGFGDRSSSPGFNSLYSSASEAKRQRLLDSKG